LSFYWMMVFDIWYATHNKYNRLGVNVAYQSKRWCVKVKADMKNNSEYKSQRGLGWYNPHGFWARLQIILCRLYNLQTNFQIILRLLCLHWLKLGILSMRQIRQKYKPDMAQQMIQVGNNVYRFLIW